MSRNGLQQNMISTVCSPFERFIIKNCHGIFFSLQISCFMSKLIFFIKNFMEIYAWGVDLIFHNICTRHFVKLKYNGSVPFLYISNRCMHRRRLVLVPFQVPSQSSSQVIYQIRPQFLIAIPILVFVIYFIPDSNLIKDSSQGLYLNPFVVSQVPFHPLRLHSYTQFIENVCSLKVK